MPSFWVFAGKGLVGATARAKTKGMAELPGFVMTETGHMNMEVFHEYIKNVFIPEIKKRGFNDKLGTLLYMDGGNDYDLRTMLLLAEHNVKVGELIPNSTAYDQPADQTFGAMQTKAVALAEEAGLEMTDEHIPTFVQMAIKELFADPKFGESAWRKCGMYPVKGWPAQFMKLHDEKKHFAMSDLRLGLSPGSPAVAEARASAEEMLAAFKKDSEEWFIQRDPKVLAALSKRAQQQAAEDEEAVGKAKGRGQDLTNVFLTSNKVLQMLADKEAVAAEKAGKKAERADIKTRVEDAKRVFEATNGRESTVRMVTGHKWQKVGAKDVMHFQVWWWHLSASKNKHNLLFRPYTEFERKNGKFEVAEIQAYVDTHNITRLEK